jgi:hypothetical protein
MNRVIVRVRHETSQRVVYPFKDMLCAWKFVSYRLRRLFTEQDHRSYCQRNNFVQSWNHHRIPGPSRGIRACSSWLPTYNYNLESSDELVESYSNASGHFNDQMRQPNQSNNTTELNRRLSLIENNDDIF